MRVQIAGFSILCLLSWGVAPVARAIDSDSDGLEDSWELALLGSLAQSGSEDPDSDDLDNASEQAAGTDPTNPDTDLDGLEDADELAAGTDPRAPDSDGDGLLDGAEYHIHGSSPLDMDTDQGGIADGTEVLRDNTDPTDPADDLVDEDGDGLPRQLEEQLGTRDDDRDTDHDGLSDRQEDSNRDGVSAGDLNGDGRFQPGEGEETSPLEWDWDGDGLSDGLEKNVYGTDPFARDTDGDGIDDGDEVWLVLDEPLLDCLSPLVADSDGDTLPDGQEYNDLQTNPCSANSDGDTVLDPVEVSDGTDPLDGNDHQPDLDSDGLSDPYEQSVSATDSTLSDSDEDGLLDSEEHFPLVDRLVTNPIDADSDDDGLLDGEESVASSIDLPYNTSPLDRDSDGDGLTDGMELGLTAPRNPAATEACPEPEPRDCGAGFVPDAHPQSTTRPDATDSDGDGLTDGSEDTDRDGLCDGFPDDLSSDPAFDGNDSLFEPAEGDETCADLRDSDGDGLQDAWELRYSAERQLTARGYDTCAPTVSDRLDPFDPSDATEDPDEDGLSSLEEYKLGDTYPPFVPTIPCRADTDRDGLDDGVEVSWEDRNTIPPGVPFSALNPNNPDTDGDGIDDGVEDANRDGFRSDLETDPLLQDSDGDGLGDGTELEGPITPDGSQQYAPTLPLEPDTDQDGLPDGQEVFGAAAPDGSRVGSTDPGARDTDGDGLCDGLELNRQPAASLETDQQEGISCPTDVDQTGSVWTDPTSTDTDGDSLSDDQEDTNRDGIWAGDADGDGRLGDGDELDPSRDDTDEDGLTDGLENWNGDGSGVINTDPLASDTDQDGLLDGEEVDVYGTRPDLADTDGGTVNDGDEVRDGTEPVSTPWDDSTGDFDGDELSNGDELAIGTDPRLMDTDADCFSDLVEVVDPAAPADTDQDGVIDALDPDSDEGTVPDNIECERDTNPLDPKDDNYGRLELGTRIKGSGLCAAHPGGWRPAGGRSSGRQAAWVLLTCLLILALRRTRRGGRAALATLLFIVLMPAAAPAQDEPVGDPDARVTSLEISPSELDPSGLGVLSTSSGRVMQHLSFRGSATLHFADRPLVVVDDKGNLVRPLVDKRSQVDTSLAMGLFDLLEFGAMLPTVVHQTASYPGAELESPGRALFASPMVYLKLSALSLKELGLDLAITTRAKLHLPDSLGGPYTGRSGHAYQSRVQASIAQGEWLGALDLGYTLQPDTRVFNIQDGDKLDARMGLRRSVPDSVNLSAELLASSDTGQFLKNGDQSSLEALLGAHREFFGSMQVQVGLGVGLVGGVGTSRYRALAQLGYHYQIPSDLDDDGYIDELDVCPEKAEDYDGYEDEDGCPEEDNDGDGILDPSDSCPLDPEDLDQFQDEDGCPEKDNDGDGLLDQVDQCPNEAEDKDGIQDEDGCPEKDVDGDGIDDPQDRCPLEGEDMDGLEDEDGCPEQDVDGDGILDPLDACPLEQEDKDGVEDQDGCPDVEVTTLTRTEIFTPEQIRFRTDRARIDRKFYRVLTEVLFLMEKNTDLNFLVEGHTDARGDPKYNQELSERRATSVRRWLLLRAKDRAGLEKRVKVRGKGEETPENSNSSRRGRQDNRRVLFLVVHEEPLGI